MNFNKKFLIGSAIILVIVALVVTLILVFRPQETQEVATPTPPDTEQEATCPTGSCDSNSQIDDTIVEKLGQETEQAGEGEETITPVDALIDHLPISNKEFSMIYFHETLSFEVYIKAATRSERANAIQANIAKWLADQKIDANSVKINYYFQS